MHIFNLFKRFKTQADNRLADGSSFANAVCIDAEDSLSGMVAEYIFMAKLYGHPGKDWRVASQSIIEQNNKVYDVISITLSNGQHKRVYFDIGKFYGK